MFPPGPALLSLPAGVPPEPALEPLASVLVLVAAPGVPPEPSGAPVESTAPVEVSLAVVLVEGVPPVTTPPVDEVVPLDEGIGLAVAPPELVVVPFELVTTLVEALDETVLSGTSDEAPGDTVDESEPPSVQLVAANAATRHSPRTLRAEIVFMNAPVKSWVRCMAPTRSDVCSPALKGQFCPPSTTRERCSKTVTQSPLTHSRGLRRVTVSRSHCSVLEP